MIAAPQKEEEKEKVDIQAELKKAGEQITKAFNDAKPQFEDLLAKGQEFFDSVGKKITEEAGKIIPKNEETKSP